MPYVTVNNAKLFFEEYGPKLDLSGEQAVEKPTIVVAHGLPGGDHTYEINMWGALADHFNIVFYDHRGHGRSDWGDSSKWTLSQWADDLYEFCNQLGIEKPIVYGDSFGSHVAFCYATKYPEHPGALIFIDAEAYFSKEEMLDAYEKVGGLEIRSLASEFFENPSAEATEKYIATAIPFISRDPVPDDFYSRVIWNMDVTEQYYLGEAFKFDYRDQLHKITCPVLYICAENGVVHRVNSARASAEKMTNAKLNFIELKGAGIASLDEIPRCRQEIIEFVNQQFDEQKGREQHSPIRD